MTIALLAAFADGRNDGSRARGAATRRRCAGHLAQHAGADAGRAAEAGLRGSGCCGTLTSPESRRLAFELAVGVCDVDGLRNEAETRFLAELGHRLGLDQPTIVETAVDADELATMPLPAAGATAQRRGRGRTARVRRGTRPDDPQCVDTERRPRTAAAVDCLDGDHSAADEARLPHRPVARIRVGQDADPRSARHARCRTDRASTWSRSGASSSVDCSARWPAALAGSLARGATGAVFSFATTYAIGEVARRYYAGGRVMSADLLKRTFSELLSQGKALQARVPAADRAAGTHARCVAHCADGAGHLVVYNSQFRTALRAGPADCFVARLANIRRLFDPARFALSCSMRLARARLSLANRLLQAPDGRVSALDASLRSRPCAPFWWCRATLWRGRGSEAAPCPRGRHRHRRCRLVGR